MSLGKSVVGAVIGAIGGLGVQVGVESFAGEQFWLPVVTGLLTGLGVRKFDPSVKSGASYLRGAVAGLIGLGGIFGGIQASSQMQVKGLADAIKTPVEITQVDPVETEDDEEEETETETAPPPEQSREVIRGTAGPENKTANTKPRDFSVWDFVMIGLGMFLSYELARGSAPHAAQAGEEGEGQGDAGESSEPAAAEGNPEEDNPQQ
ncbi:MAG: hypothetical protein AAGF31_00165 [Planctomycetota bacterium]